MPQTTQANPGNEGTRKLQTLHADHWDGTSELVSTFPSIVSSRLANLYNGFTLKMSFQSTRIRSICRV